MSSAGFGSIISSWRVFSLTVLASVACGLTMSCGSVGTVSNTTPPPANTQVTVMLTSTANDQLAQFDINFNGISLTSQSGNTVNLYTATQGSGFGAEFIHINGTGEPIATASIPQDAYTSATVALGAAQFVCVDLYSTGSGEPGILATTTFNDAGVASSDVTVSLPVPITVTGTSMNLAIDLQIAQSETYSACYNPLGKYVYSITPDFSLAGLTLSALPTNDGKGEVSGVEGQITSMGPNGNSLMISIADPLNARPLSVTTDSNTMYQGISDFSALAVGTFVNLDGAIQPDGSVLATRIAVQDSSAMNILGGPVLGVGSSDSYLLMLPRYQQGSSVTGTALSGSMDLNFSTTLFQISGQFDNLKLLPFDAEFDGSNVVPGQNVYFSTGAIPESGPYVSANTATLMPQTIDGTLTATSMAGSFTDDTVSLASDDLFPMLASQPGQTAPESNPSQIEVYVDSNTKQLNSHALAVGNTYRFYGLVFNDNGTLRMDCAQVNDGVAFTAPANTNSQMQATHVRTIRQQSTGGMQTTTTVTRSQ